MKARIYNQRQRPLLSSSCYLLVMCYLLSLVIDNRIADIRIIPWVMVDATTALEVGVASPYPLNAHAWKPMT